MLRNNYFVIQETEAALINEAIYKSLLTQQQQKLSESSLLIYDTGRYANFYGLTPYNLLLYILKKQPWIAGVIHDTSVGKFSYGPRGWVRDDHVVLVKEKCKLKDSEKNELIDKLSDNLSKEEVDIIQRIMQKFIATKGNDKGCDIINSLNVEKKEVDLKIESIKTIKMWFDNVVLGPFCITRSVCYDDSVNLTAAQLADPLTAKLLNEMEMVEDFWCFEVNYLLLLDSNYFIISGKNNEEMQWISEIPCYYIGIAEQQQLVATEQYDSIYKYPKKGITGYSNVNDKIFFQEVIVEYNNADKQLKMEYGGHTFLGVGNIITEIMNSIRFQQWMQGDGVKLNLWLGRDEVEKIKDYRTMKTQITELQNENEMLQKQNEKLKRNEK